MDTHGSKNTSHELTVSIILLPDHGVNVAPADSAMEWTIPNTPQVIELPPQEFSTAAHSRERHHVAVDHAAAAAAAAEMWDGASGGYVPDEPVEVHMPDNPQVTPPPPDRAHTPCVLCSAYLASWAAFPIIAGS
jgi:hypothetical protein